MQSSACGLCQRVTWKFMMIVLVQICTVKQDVMACLKVYITLKYWT